MISQLGITKFGPARTAVPPRATERRELRSGQGQPLSGLAGRPDPEGPPEGHGRRGVVAERRPEVALDFEREVYGHVPQGVPRVTWTVAKTADNDRRRTAGRRPACDRARGQLRSSRDHGRRQDGRGGAGQREGTGPGPHDVRLGQHARRAVAALRSSRRLPPRPNEPLIAAGWGDVSLSTASIQADNGAGLTAGIIGLTNKAIVARPSSGGRSARGPGARPGRSTISVVERPGRPQAHARSVPHCSGVQRSPLCS